MKKSMRVSICILCLLSLIVLCVACGMNTNYIRRMQALEENVQNPTTIDELKDAITKYEKRVEDVVNAEIKIGIWYKMLGSRYIDNQMYAEALEAFESAIQYYPLNQNLFYYVGVCAGYMAKASLDYNATGNMQASRYLALSESAYLRAIELEPKYVRALYGLGVLYVFEMNEDAKAIAYLETALSVETRNIDIMFVLSRAYYVVGEYDRAIELYDRIMDTTKDPLRKAEADANKKVVLDALYK